MLSSDRGTIHIIGAGMAGLAAAVRLVDSGRRIAIHEASLQPGGRCRSYYDHATGMLIDNGTHVVLSGNHAVLSYTRAIGSEAGLQVSAEAEFPFVDLTTKARWSLRFNDGRVPWWVFDKDRRVPETSVADYLPLARLALPTGEKPIGEVMDCTGPIYERLLSPLLLAALNIEPSQGSAKLAATLIRETLALGGKACRPLLATDGIGNVFVEPAVAHLRNRGASLTLQDELIKMTFTSGCVSQLEFSDRTETLGENDAVILAVTPYAASKLMPDLTTPTVFRGIVNAHFRVTPAADMPPMLGVINGTCEWIFSFQDRMSVTISNADRLFNVPREELAASIWAEVAAVAGLPADLPPWQIVRERRATFAATPEQNALRPKAETAWRNLVLAGDWTATGLPATLEGAIRSGYRAADLIGDRIRAAA
jgi:squalene-associated FAD-dependent desaturase